jgi:cellobiose-specific phosphotransferase system component IIC
MNLEQQDRKAMEIIIKIMLSVLIYPFLLVVCILSGVLLFLSCLTWLPFYLIRNKIWDKEDSEWF